MNWNIVYIMYSEKAGSKTKLDRSDYKSTKSSHNVVKLDHTCRVDSFVVIMGIHRIKFCHYSCLVCVHCSISV